MEVGGQFLEVSSLLPLCSRGGTQVLRLAQETLLPTEPLRLNKHNFSNLVSL